MYQLYSVLCKITIWEQVLCHVFGLLPSELLRICKEGRLGSEDFRHAYHEFWQGLDVYGAGMSACYFSDPI